MTNNIEHLIGHLDSFVSEVPVQSCAHFLNCVFCLVITEL